MIMTLLLALSMQPNVDRNSTGRAIMEACNSSASGLRGEWTMEELSGFMECKGYSMAILDSLVLTREVCLPRRFNGSDRDSNDVVKAVAAYLRHMPVQKRREPRYFAVKDALVAAYPCR